MELTQSVSYTYGKATLTWFEEIFEEYEIEFCLTSQYRRIGFLDFLENYDKIKDMKNGDSSCLV